MNFFNLIVRSRLVNFQKFILCIFIFGISSGMDLEVVQAQTFPACEYTTVQKDYTGGPYATMGKAASEASGFIQRNPTYLDPSDGLPRTWEYDKICLSQGEPAISIALNGGTFANDPRVLFFVCSNSSNCTELEAAGVWEEVFDCKGKKSIKQTKTGTGVGAKTILRTSDGASMADGGTHTSENCVAKKPTAKPKACPDCNHVKNGSIIQVEGQILGQALPITGTPFNLVYNTDKTPGYRTGSNLEINLTDSVVPHLLQRIVLTVDVAGRRHTIEYDKNPGPTLIKANLIHDFTWDGLDAYGRQVSGTVKAKVRIQYFYETQKGFDTEGSGAKLIYDLGSLANPGTLDSYNTRISEPNVLEYTANLEVKDHRANGLGGWSIDANHVYDARGEILHMGNGTRMSSQDLPDVITTVNGGQVTTNHIATDSKGNIYFSDTAGHKIKKINLQGTVSDIVGTGIAGDEGNGPFDMSQATPKIDSPTYLAIDIHDNLYFYDEGKFRIRKVDFAAEKMFSLVGKGFANPPELNKQGYDTHIRELKGLTVDKFGNVYYMDFFPILTGGGEYRILRWSDDGYVRLHFGEKYLSVTDNPISLASDLEGNLYIADTGSIEPQTLQHINSRVIRITNTGVFSVIAGNGEDNDGTNTVDGVLGTESPVRPSAVAFRDGKVYIADRDSVRMVTTDGIISTIAGTGTIEPYKSDNYPAVSSKIEPVSIAFDLLGNPLVADATDTKESIRKIASPLPSLLDGTIKIPSSDGSVLYEFDSTGRHLNTKSTLTGATLLTFNYDADGKLDDIVDGDGDTTDFVYDANGDLEKVVSEDGLETLAEPDGHGFLASLTYPNTLYDEVIDFEYDPNGLMESMDDAKGNTHLFRYNSKGQLEEDENPEGGILKLARTIVDPEDHDPSEYEIKVTSPEGREELTKVKTLSDSGKRRTISTDTSGFATTTTLNKDQSATAELPDKTEITSSKSPDARFNFISPLAALSVKLPSANELKLERKRTFDPPVMDPDNPLTYTSVKEELIIGEGSNERTFESVFTKATNTFVSKSAATPPRVTTTEIDDLERVTKRHIEEIIDAEFKYDSRGRLEFIRQGCESETSCNDGRETGILYDTDGFVQSVTDALDQVTSFKYDKLGRVTEQTLPTSPGIPARKVVFEYDQNGNLESLTPPGRPSHTYLHTALDLEKEYTPPDHPEISIERTKYDYNADQQPELITRPDNKTIDLNYDSGGRLKEYITSDGATTEFKYFETATDTESFGNIKSITAPGTPSNETLTFTYDGGLLKSTTWGGTVSGFISLTHDSSFRVTSSTVSESGATPVEVVARYAYDEDDLLESVQYDPDGTAGNGDEFELDLVNSTLNGLLQETKLYDNAATPVEKVSDEYQYFNPAAVAPEPNDKGYGEVYEYKASVAGNGVLFKTVFERDKLGRIKKKTETLNGTTTHVYEYTYYPEGMLKTVAVDSGTPTTYTYDANFNRLSNGAVYDVQDRLTSTATATYTYNDNGELATKVDASGTTTYTYDVLGNLRQVDPPLTNDVIDYIIDGRNRKIAKKVNGTITKKWLYADQLNPIAELDLNDNITKRFIYGTRSNIPDVMVDVSGANPVVYRIISDHLGSPRFVIDISNGTTALELSYNEWGVETVVSGNRDLIPFGFAGGLYDQDTKLVRFGARDYDPEIGRWTSKDPIEFEGGDTNLFGYVLNDPVNSIDPTGECPFCVKYGIDFTIEVILQLMQNGGRIECVNWSKAGKNALESFFLPPGVAKVAKGAAKFAKGANKGAKRPEIKAPYKRPNNATTSAQRKSVQNKPCVDCGETTPKQVADHKLPLVKEYYETGKIDKSKMRSMDAVQPQCPTCSARQGAEMSRYSKQKRRTLVYEYRQNRNFTEKTM